MPLPPGPVGDRENLLFLLREVPISIKDLFLLGVSDLIIQRKPQGFTSRILLFVQDFGQFNHRRILLG